MNINMPYAEQLLKNQSEYIRRFQKSIYGIKKIPILDDDTLSDATFERNKLLIQQINHMRIRRAVQAARRQLDKHRYLFKHPDAAREIRKIKREKMQQVYLSVACIIKNEGAYLQEWLEFHLAAGVERFYIFDNDSGDNTYSVLQPYIEKKTVVYIRFPGQRVQMDAYNIACDLCRGVSRWLALIDADEFLHPVQQSDLKSVLKEYEQFPAVGVNWVVYGPCGHQSAPEGLLCENYTLTFSDYHNELNCRIKSIVDPKQVLASVSPHYCLYKKGRYAVDENKEEIWGEAVYARNSSMSCTMFHHRAILRINHYWTKSEEELRTKCNRGYPDGQPNPEFDKILKRLDYPLTEDAQTVWPFLSNFK